MDDNGYDVDHYLSYYDKVEIVHYKQFVVLLMQLFERVFGLVNKQLKEDLSDFQLYHRLSIKFKSMYHFHNCHLHL